MNLASLSSGSRPGRRGAQTNSGVQVNLLGVLGTFDSWSTVRGLLSGHSTSSCPQVDVSRPIAQDRSRRRHGHGGGHHDQLRPGEHRPEPGDRAIDEAVIQFQAFAAARPIRRSIRPLARTDRRATRLGLRIRKNGPLRPRRARTLLRVHRALSTATTHRSATVQRCRGRRRPRPYIDGRSRSAASSSSTTSAYHRELQLHRRPVVPLRWIDAIGVGRGQVFPGKPFNATITDRQTRRRLKPNGQRGHRGVALPARLRPARSGHGLRVRDRHAEAQHQQLHRGHRRRVPPEHRRRRHRGPRVLHPGRCQGPDRRPPDRWRGAQLLRSLATARSRPGRASACSSRSARRVGDSFKWPCWLPVQINAIGIEWPNFETDPARFLITLSVAITKLPSVAGLKFSGAIEGLKIDPSLLLQGKFPIIEVRSIAVSITGKLFGGELTARCSAAS